MADEIREGAVVQLKSGGPIMTVEKLEEWDGVTKARCQWFTGKENQVSVFPLVVLKLADQKTDGPPVGKPGTWS